MQQVLIPCRNNVDFILCKVKAKLGSQVCYIWLGLPIGPLKCLTYVVTLEMIVLQASFLKLITLKSEKTENIKWQIYIK